MRDGVFSHEWTTIRDLIASDITALLFNIHSIKSTIVNNKTTKE